MSRSFSTVPVLVPGDAFSTKDHDASFLPMLLHFTYDYDALVTIFITIVSSLSVALKFTY